MPLWMLGKGDFVSFVVDVLWQGTAEVFLEAVPLFFFGCCFGCWLMSSHKRSLMFRNILGLFGCQLMSRLTFRSTLGFLCPGFFCCLLSRWSILFTVLGGGHGHRWRRIIWKNKCDVLDKVFYTLIMLSLAIMIECKYSISQGSFRTFEAFKVPTQCTSSSKKPKPIPE